MAIDVLPDRQYTAPAAADSVTLTMPGTLWGNSAYGELHAAVTADCILTGLAIRPINQFLIGFGFEVDISIGAAASEVPVATFKAYFQEVNAVIASECLYIPTIIGIDAIPNGSRVSARWRGATATAKQAAVAITYLKKPLTGTLLTTTNPLLGTPAGASPLGVVAGTSWATGTPQEIWDNTNESRAIVGVSLIVAVAGIDWEVDLLVGDDEVVATTLHVAHGGVSSFPNYWAFPHPLIIPAMTKLAAQTRTDDASTVRTALVSVSYVELPL